MWQNIHVLKVRVGLLLAVTVETLLQSENTDVWSSWYVGLGFYSLPVGVSFVLLTEEDLQHLLPGPEPQPGTLCIPSPCYGSRVKCWCLSTQCSHSLGVGGGISLGWLGVCAQNLLWWALFDVSFKFLLKPWKCVHKTHKTLPADDRQSQSCVKSFIRKFLGLSFFFSVCLRFPTHEIKIPTLPFFQAFLSVLIQSCSGMLLCRVSSQCWAEGGCQSQLGACITAHSVVTQIVDNIIMMQKRK